MTTGSSLRQMLDSKEWAISEERVTLLTLDFSGHYVEQLPEELYGIEELEALDLTGKKGIKLPNELTKLQNLKVLNLNDCNLTTVPAVVMKLPQLQTLILSNNENIILPDEMSGLTNIRVLKLNKTNMVTVPTVVWRLTHLHTLELGSNTLNVLNAEIGLLSNMEHLNLSKCNLHTLPLEIWRLIQLRWLDVRFNPIQMLPAGVGQLTNIKHLNLSYCKLRILPPEIGNLTQLEWLDLCGNQLQTLPGEVRYLTNVKHLYLHSCNMHTLPPEVGRLTQLQWLGLSSNNLQTLPSEIGQLTNIKHFDLSLCKLRTLPPEVGRLTQLEWLELSQNPLQTLPADIRQLTCLKHLDMSYCQLTLLPREVGALTQLECLVMIRNPLQMLTTDVQHIINIESFNLSQCQLTTLPPEIGRLAHLRWLDLSYNPLQILPPNLGQLSSIRHLDLSHCKLHTLPRELGKLTQIEWLDLSFNPLQVLLAEVGQLTNVKHLDMSECKLHSIPPEVGKLTQLEWLHLSSNPLKTLPPEVGQLANVTHLDMSECKLRTLPPEVGRLEQLKWLNLSSNPLQALPAQIGQLNNIQNLDLSSCELTTLPPEIGKLTQLERLNVSDNPLQTLPAEIVHLTNISHLKISTRTLSKPPAEVCRQGIATIRQYFEELERSEEDVSAHLKVVVLGEKMAGKTSLVQTLRRGLSTLTRQEDRTHCVEITQWAPDDNITFEVYDFGGHNVYHLTHQFFLTPDAFYLLLVNLKTYNCSEQSYTEAVGFWLDTLNARVPGAVVSLVGTKKDLCRPVEKNAKTKDIQRRVKQQRNMWEKELRQQISILTSMQMRYKECDLKSVEDTDKHLLRAKRLLNHGLRVIDDIPCVSVKPKFPVFVSRSPPSWAKFRDFLLETANNKELFPTLTRILPRTWVEFEQLLQRPASDKPSGDSNRSIVMTATDGTSALEEIKHPTQHCLTTADCARIGQLAGLSSDRLEPALSYLQQVGTILRYTDIPELKDFVFHDPPSLIEIFKDLFHHDTDTLFSTANQKLVRFTSPKLDGFQLDLCDRGLIQEEVMKCLLSDDIHLDIVTALMQNFGLCFEIRTEDTSDPSKHTVLYKVPWYLHKEMPKELMSVWAEDVPEKDEQLQLMCDIRGFCPQGLFQRFSVGIHPLVNDRTDWKDGAMAYRQDYPVLVCSKPVADDTYITMATRGRPDQAGEMWGVVHPLLEVLVQLLQEWPGVLYSLHVTCAHCIKARLDNPHQYDLRDRTADDGRDVRCPRVKRTASTSADLVYRPSRLSVVTRRTSLTQMRPSQQNDYYRMTSDPRGLALIISNIKFTDPSRNRPGGEKDLDTLRKICEKLKLQEEIREDLTSQEIETVAKDVSRRDHGSYDCFVLFLLSHGGETGVLGTDGQHVSVDSIVSSFQACKNLVGKPKLFFIQACRGVDMDPGHEHTDTTTDKECSTSRAGREASDGAPDQVTESPIPSTAPAASAASLESPDAGERTLPTASDRLVMYATVHGHVSWRNSNSGTWLIQVLADVITEHAETETLLEMLTRVNAKVADFKTQHQEYKQQPEVTHTLRKKLYFFPQASVDQNP
uniref:Leucine-rich repeat protein SHOC-2 n=1 Tax=Branchiostoma floridae TaxID=7739 RepID=C3ZI91_BRAFL|eukprot:XP_002591605.1 hypothetical protein BRAFLDRAFT_80701 [Branchiostoma floridae]